MRPPPINAEKKWFVFAAGYLLFCALYILTGKLHLRTPASVPESTVDALIPFVGWTVWIYHSQFFFLLISVRTLKTPALISAALYSMGLASLLSFFIFFFFPTTLPRPSILSEGLTADAFRALYSVDTTSNCVPSLHVALAGVGAFGMAKQNVRAGIFGVTWAVLLSISTMTTKQHHFSDVLAGIGVAAVCSLVAMRWFR